MTYTYTHVKELDVDVYVCNDCGAQGITEKQVFHYSNCKPYEEDDMAIVESKALKVTLGVVVGIVLVILLSIMVLCVTTTAISMWDVSQYAGTIWK